VKEPRFRGSEVPGFRGSLEVPGFRGSGSGVPGFRFRGSGFASGPGWSNPGTRNPQANPGTPELRNPGTCRAFLSV
jgi:hypothetical protein